MDNVKEIPEEHFTLPDGDLDRAKRIQRLAIIVEAVQAEQNSLHGYAQQLTAAMAKAKDQNQDTALLEDEQDENDDHDNNYDLILQCLEEIQVADQKYLSA